MDRRTGWQRLARALPGGASQRVSRALRRGADQLQSPAAAVPTELTESPARALPAAGGSSFIRERALRSLAEARQTMTGLVSDPPADDVADEGGSQAALTAEIRALRGSMGAVQTELTALREEFVTLRVTLRAALIGGGGVADAVPEPEGDPDVGAGAPHDPATDRGAEQASSPGLLTQVAGPTCAPAATAVDHHERSRPTLMTGSAEEKRSTPAVGAALSAGADIAPPEEATDGAWSEESSTSARSGDAPPTTAAASAQAGPLSPGSSAPAAEAASIASAPAGGARIEAEPVVMAPAHVASGVTPVPAGALGQQPPPDSHEHEYRALRARWFAAGTVGTRIALRPAPAPDALQQMLLRLQREALVEHAEALPEEEGAAMLRLTLRMPLRWDDFGGLVERVLARPLAAGEAGWARGAVRIRLTESGR